MSDEDLKQLIVSNAKAIQALEDVEDRQATRLEILDRLSAKDKEV
jgi:hypothetical protein